MDRESILGDLRKFAGGIQGAQKISLPEEKSTVIPNRGRPKKSKIDSITPPNPQPQPQPPPNPNPQPQPQPQPPQITLKNVAALIKTKLTPVMRNGEPLSVDNATMDLICEKQHQHRVFIKDIINTNGNVNCKTCTHGSKFTTMIREAAESIVKLPFTLSDTITRNRPQTCEFRNDEHFVIIECCKISGPAHLGEIVNDKLLISVSYTTSQRKIYSAILAAFKNHKDWFLEETAANINAAVAEDSKPKKPPGEVKQNIFQEDPIPYSSESADMILAARKPTNHFLAKMQMNIVGAKDANALCIENCSKIEL